MRNIYIHQCTQMLMIKTFPGGSGATGYVKDSVFENFWAYDSTYGLGIFFLSPLSPTSCTDEYQISINTGNPTQRPTPAPLL
jgi:hypothetical protein